MNAFNKTGLLRVGLALSGWLALSIPALAGQFYEDFQGYVPGTNVNAIGGGWGAWGAGAVVTNMDFTNAAAGNLAAVLQPESTVTNGANVAGEPVMWTECWLGESNHIVATYDLGVDTNAVFMAGLSTNGYLYLYNPGPGSWEECRTDVWNHAVSPATDLWTRVTVLQNFTNHQAAFLVNDHLVRQQIRFINTNVTGYSRFRADSGTAGESGLDNVLISNALPSASSRRDTDGDGRPDVLELLLYEGSATNWNGVAVTGRVATAHGTVTPSGGLLVPLDGATNFNYQATSPGYVLDRVLTNGGTAVSYAASPVTSGSFTWSNIVAEESVFEVQFRYDGALYVPGNADSITGALAVAESGARIVIADGSYAESLAISNNVTLIGTNVSDLVSITVVTGVTATVSGFTDLGVSGAVTVGSNATLVVTNGTVSFGSLSIAAGGSLRVTNGTVTVNGATVSGTFTYDQDWDAAVKVMPINFTDGFEAYGVGSPLTALKAFGWSASDAGVVVAVPTIKAPSSTNAVLLPVNTIVSNRVDGAGFNGLWTDVYLRETNHVAEPPDVAATNGGPAVVAYIGTNGYLTVFNRGVVGGWDVCSNDARNGSAPKATGDWARVTWFIDFARTNAAFFLDGHLLREQVPLIGSVTHYSSLRADGGSAGAAYLDSVRIWTNVPTGLADGAEGDLDQDGIADAQEIQQSGSIALYPRGSVFKIR